MSSNTSFQINTTLYPELTKYWYNVLAITGHIKLQGGIETECFEHVYHSKVTRTFDVSTIEKGYEKVPDVFVEEDGFLMLRPRWEIDKMLKSMKDVNKARAIDMFVHMVNEIRGIDFVNVYLKKKGVAKKSEEQDVHKTHENHANQEDHKVQKKHQKKHYKDQKK